MYRQTEGGTYCQKTAPGEAPVAPQLDCPDDIYFSWDGQFSLKSLLPTMPTVYHRKRVFESEICSTYAPNTMA